MQSYLSNRKQYTKVENCKSNLTKIEYGVLQGSSLGPLLFLSYINNLALASQFDTILFADYTFLAMSDNNLSQLQNRVKTELRKIHFWMKKKKLQVNHSKTHYLLLNKQLNCSFLANFNVSLNSNNIKRIRSRKYLEIYTDENLNWPCYIQYLSIQLARYSGLLYRLRKFLFIYLFYLPRYSHALSSKKKTNRKS